MNGQSCKTCRFFRPIQYLLMAAPSGVGLLPEPDNRFEGVCRHKPPAVTEDFSAVARHPGVFGREWCGEWQPANPETVEQGAAVMARLVLLGDMTAARALADKLTGGD